jgi:hypothetical protein
MADLLPSIASDEEIDLKEPDDEDDSVGGDEVDRSFEFGGILVSFGNIVFFFPFLYNSDFYPNPRPCLLYQKGEDGGDIHVQKVNNGWSFQSALDQSKTKGPTRMDVASLISAKRKALKQVSEEENDPEESDPEEIREGKDGNEDSDTDISSDSSDDDDEEIDDADRQMEEDVVKTRTGEDDNQDSEESESNDEDEDEEEAAKAAAFYENQSVVGSAKRVSLFVELQLSRPLLRGVAAMGFTKPTDIQAACLPVALAGKDICASAVTGSGKTAGKFLFAMHQPDLKRKET